LYKYILIIISFLCSSSLDNWESLTSKLSPNKIIKYNDNILINTSGGLLLYNTSAQTFSDFNLNNPNTCLEISDFDIDINNELWVLCSNGVLFKENSNFGINHLIDINDTYSLSFSDESVFFLYEGDNYGIIEGAYNDSGVFFKDYYYGFSSPDARFIKLITLNNSIYLLTSEGIYFSDLDSELKDSLSWSLIESTDNVIDILGYGELIALFSNNQINFVDTNNQIISSVDYNIGDFIQSFVNSDSIYVLGSQGVFKYSELENSNISNNEIDFSDAKSIFVEELKIYIGMNNQAFSIIEDDIVYKCSPNTFIESDEGFPIVEALTYHDGNLYGVNRNGIFIYDGESFVNLINASTVLFPHSYLTLQNFYDCNHFMANQLSYVPGEKISSSVVFHEDKIYFPNSGIFPNESTNRGGLIIVDLNNFEETIIGDSYLDGQNGIYNTDWDNNYITINQVKVDNYGRVWIVNPYAENEPYQILAYYDSNDDEWGHIQAPDNVSYLPQEIAFDKLGRLWVAFEYKSQLDEGGDYSNGGIKVVSRQGYWLDEIENLEALPSASNEVGTSVWSLDFGSFQGNDILWVLTSNGVQGYSISSQPRIDPIYPIDFFTDIQFRLGDKVRVDSQNNVWILTTHSGVRVIKNDISFWPSESGITTENSDILSNVVTDIAFDDINGRAFLATDKGVSVLEIPFSENRSNQDVGVSPNPFVIGESNYITIDNMYSGSTIKIMTLSGNVVKKIDLPYNENRINWDGKGDNGESLDTGVYLIVVENNQYGNGVTKLAIIK